VTFADREKAAASFGMIRGRCGEPFAQKVSDATAGKPDGAIVVDAICTALLMLESGAESSPYGWMSWRPTAAQYRWAAYCVVKTAYPDVPFLITTMETA